MEFYKIYKDLIVRKAIDGNIEYDIDVICLVKMEKYASMGINIASWNRNNIGMDYLYKSEPFELSINEDYTLIEIYEVLEPENKRERNYYKEITFKLKNKSGELFDFRRDFSVAWDNLPFWIKNRYRNDIEIFLINPFGPVEYSKLQFQLEVIRNSLNLTQINFK